jgi:hypothetical protein
VVLAVVGSSGDGSDWGSSSGGGSTGGSSYDCG